MTSIRAWTVQVNDKVNIRYNTSVNKSNHMESGHHKFPTRGKKGSKIPYKKQIYH
jgi:hypothetical protein